jgi:hypothetical protein
MAEDRKAQASVLRPFQIEEIAVRKLQSLGPIGGARDPPE